MTFVIAQVKSISHIKGAVSAPITMSGTILVNGVVASCYAHGSHEVLHAILAPFRTLHRISPKLSKVLATAGISFMNGMGTLFAIEHHLELSLLLSVVVALLTPIVPFALFFLLPDREKRSV